MQVIAEVLYQRQVVMENSKMKWVNHRNVHAIRKNALLAKLVDLLFSNLFAKYFLAHFFELVNV